jgi:hypothetical protein
MQKPLLAWGSIVVGLVIIVLSGLADALSLGRLPGFGWKQAAGVALGIALVVCGVYWRRRLRATRSPQ